MQMLTWACKGAGLQAASAQQAGVDAWPTHSSAEKAFMMLPAGIATATIHTAPLIAEICQDRPGRANGLVSRLPVPSRQALMPGWLSSGLEVLKDAACAGDLSGHHSLTSLLLHSLP